MKVRIIILTILVALVTCGAAKPAEDARFTKGLAEFNAGNWSQAANLLLAAASTAPGDVTVRLTAGVALANVKRYTEALDQFKTSAHLAPEGVLPQLLLDGTYSEMGNQVEARNARDRANRMLATGGAFGNPASSDQVLAKSLRTYPDNSIAHCLLGDLYQLQGKLGPAREQYTQASKLAPKWSKPVFNLGLSNLQSDPRAAETNFLQVTRMDPMNSRAYLWLGDARLQQENISGAIEAYNSAAKNPATAAEARTRIGNAQFRAGDLKMAQYNFQVAANQAPGDPRPIAGEAQVLKVEGKLQEAERKYGQAIDVAAQNSMPQSQAYVQNQMGVVQAQQGKFDQATANLMEAFRLNPTLQNAEALALAHQRAGTLTQAIESSESALQRSPRAKTPMIFLLAAYKLTGNLSGALDVSQMLVKADPSNAHIYRAEAGCVYEKQGNIAKAIESYAEALEKSKVGGWPAVIESAEKSGTLDLLTSYYQKEFKSDGRPADGLILFELQSHLGNTAGMLSTAKALVKSKPSDALFQLKLGIAYEKSGDKASALAAYKKAATGGDTDAAGLARSKVEALEK